MDIPLLDDVPEEDDYEDDENVDGDEDTVVLSAEESAAACYDSCVSELEQTDIPDSIPSVETIKLYTENINLYKTKAIHKIPQCNRGMIMDSANMKLSVLKMQKEETTRLGLQSFMDTNTVIVDIMTHLECDIIPDSMPGQSAGLLYYIQIMFSKCL